MGRVDSRGKRQRGRTLFRGVALGLLAVLGCLSPALGGDDDDDEPSKAGPKLPNIYLDYNTQYTIVPPNTLAIGFRNFVSPIPVGSQSVMLNAPLTIDLTDWFSLYGGVSAITSRSDISPWSSMILDSWNVGFNADVIRQSGATVTVISTLTRSINSAPGLGSTSNQTVIELDHALNEDETRGLLAGTRLTAVWVDSAIAKVEPAFVGYLGGYYQWDNNWKLSGRFGIQNFGGAQIAGGLIRAKAFTQPTMRIDLERMDDNDNRLFGATIEVSWMPEPFVQFTLRTPLYAVRN
jgi:opacity protein-like surface antigen